jgi:hypothetical protein
MKEGLKLFLLPTAVLALLIGSITTEVIGQEFVIDGLISFWTFDNADIEDNVAKDIIGENDGFTQGEPEIVEGMIGEALSFDGVDDLVEVPINNDLSREGADELTIEAWIMAEIPCHGVLCGRDYWIIHWGGCGGLPQSMRFYVGVGGWKSVNSVGFADDNWHHWVGVYDGSQIRLYLDGERDAALPLAGEIAGTSDGHADWIVFGKDYHTSVNNDRWNSVVIDEVRIYERGLTDEEVKQNFLVKSNKIAVESVGKITAAWGKIKTSYQRVAE